MDRPAWSRSSSGSRLRARQRGQSIVEFGIVAVIFFFLIMGILDFGMTMNAWIAVGSSAREGARQAAIGATPGEVRALIQKVPFPGVDRTQGPIRVDVWVRTQCPSGCKYTGAEDWTLVTTSTYPNHADGTAMPRQGDWIRVRVTAEYFELVTPVVRAAFGCAGAAPRCFVPLRSETIVRYEGVFVS